MVLITMCAVYAIKQKLWYYPFKTVFSQVYNMVLITVRTVYGTTAFKVFVFSGVQYGVDFRVHGVRDQDAKST